MRPSALIKQYDAANLEAEDGSIVMLGESRNSKLQRQRSNGEQVPRASSIQLMNSGNRADRRAADAKSRKLMAPVSAGYMRDQLSLVRGRTQTNSLRLAEVFAPSTKKEFNSQTVNLVVEFADRWAEVRETLAEWECLEEGWDGEEASVVDQRLLDIALAFVTTAEAHGIAPPRPYIADSSDIGFIWDGARKASVTFLGSDRFLAVCPRDGKDDLRVAGPLDIALCSHSLFDNLRDNYPADVD